MLIDAEGRLVQTTTQCYGKEMFVLVPILQCFAGSLSCPTEFNNVCSTSQRLLWCCLAMYPGFPDCMRSLFHTPTISKQNDNICVAARFLDS